MRPTIGVMPLYDNERKSIWIFIERKNKLSVGNNLFVVMKWSVSL